MTIWFKQDWTEFCKHNKQAEPTDPQVSLRGSARAHMGINMAMRYVQDRHGSAVDGYVAAMMRALARAIWVELGICGAAPTTWKQVDAQSRDAYYCAMNVGFFELRLCDANWKAEQIATTYYSAWHFKWCEYFQTRSLTLPVAVEVPTAGPSTRKGAPSKRRKVKASAVSFTGLLPKHTHTDVGHQGSVHVWTSKIINFFHASMLGFYFVCNMYYYSVCKAGWTITM